MQTPAARNGVNRYNFLGKETQFTTGYIDLQARFYDPLTGRFMQVDPITEGQDAFSPYHYSFDNPIRFSDPDGRWPDDSPDVLSVSGNFAKGLGQSAWGTVTGVYGAVRHPINTATAIGSAVAHPINTANAIGNAVSDGYSEFQAGNADVKANIAGKVIGDVAQLFVGAGEVKAGLNGLKGARVAEEAGVLSNLGNASTIVEKSVITGGDALRIENAATRINKPITIVGSRASDAAKATSDWDYVITGMNNKEWKKVKNSLPGSPSRIDNAGRNIDVFKGDVDKSKPYITINPRKK